MRAALAQATSMGKEAGVGDALVGAEADGGGADDGEAEVELGSLEGVETG